MTFLLSQLAGQAHASTTKFGCYFVRGSGCVQAQETYLELWHQCRWVLYDGLEQLQIQTIIRLRPPVTAQFQEAHPFCCEQQSRCQRSRGRQSLVRPCLTCMCKQSFCLRIILLTHDSCYDWRMLVWWKTCCLSAGLCLRTHAASRCFTTLTPPKVATICRWQSKLLWR